MENVKFTDIEMLRFDMASIDMVLIYLMKACTEI